MPLHVLFANKLHCVGAVACWDIVLTDSRTVSGMNWQPGWSADGPGAESPPGSGTLSVPSVFRTFCSAAQELIMWAWWREANGCAVCFHGLTCCYYLYVTSSRILIGIRSRCCESFIRWASGVSGAGMWSVFGRWSPTELLPTLKLLTVWTLQTFYQVFNLIHTNYEEEEKDEMLNSISLFSLILLFCFSDSYFNHMNVGIT